MAPKIGSVVKVGHGSPCGFTLVTNFSKAWPFYHYSDIWRPCSPGLKGKVVRIVRGRFYQNILGVDWVYAKIPRKGRYQFAVLFYKGGRRIA